MLIGNIENMWVKPRVQTPNTPTDWRTTHEVQGCSKTKMGVSSSPLLLSHEQFLASGRKLCPHYTDTCPLHFKTNTKLLRLHPWSLSARSHKGPDCKTVRTTSFLFSKPPTFLHRPSFLPVCPSLFFWNSLQKPAKLQCHVTLTSQIKWHTGYNLITL